MVPRRFTTSGFGIGLAWLGAVAVAVASAAEPVRERTDEAERAEPVAAAPVADGEAGGSAGTPAPRAGGRFEVIPPMAPAGRGAGTARALPPGGTGGPADAIELQPIHFPPNPPPLGVEVVAGRRGRLAPLYAPEPLTRLVMAPFYAPLSTRLVRGDLKEAHRERINRWWRERRAAVETMLDALWGLEGAEPEARASSLRLLAAQQSATLRRLEREAEVLRAELYRSGGGRADGDWNAHREWRLGKGALKKPREEIALFEYQVLRAAAFYYEGLLPEQRLLLREMAMELEDVVFREDSRPVSAFGFVFFSPHMARIRFPETLSPAVRDMVAGYVAEKQRLKSELRELVYRLEGYAFRFSREEACRELAEKQKAALRELEAMAEAIRGELAAEAVFERAPMPEPLPERLERMIERFLSGKQRLQAEFLERLRELRLRLPPPQPWAGEQERSVWEEQIERAADRIAKAYRKEVAAELRGLGELLTAIEAGLEKATGTPVESDFGGSADAFLTEFVAERRGAESRFLYETAVLEPGLSPEQRRLLFAEAVERMGLPLPGAEPQPRRLPGTLLK